MPAELPGIEVCIDCALPTAHPRNCPVCGMGPYCADCLMAHDAFVPHDPDTPDEGQTKGDGA